MKSAADISYQIIRLFGIIKSQTTNNKFNENNLCTTNEIFDIIKI